MATSANGAKKGGKAKPVPRSEAYRFGASVQPTVTLIYEFTPPAPPCPADWNGDGAVDSADISAFITSWLASIAAGELAADFNGDGAVNSGDISAFLTAWIAAVGGGC